MILLLRFNEYRKYYLSALALLFFAFPESISLFNFSAYFNGHAAERLESAVITLVFLAIYGWLLLSLRKVWFKLTVAVAIDFLLVFVSLTRLRGDNGPGQLLSYLFEAHCFYTLIPLFILFFILCTLDTVKRTPCVAWCLGGLACAFALNGYLNQKTTGNLDWKLAQDVKERLARADFESSQELFQECLRIHEERNRQKCVVAVAQKLQISACNLEEQQEGDRSSCLSDMARALDNNDSKLHLESEPLKAFLPH